MSTNKTAGEAAPQQTLEEATVGTIEVVSAALEKAAAAHEHREKEAAAVASSAGEVADALVTAGLIEPEERERMPGVLASHSQCVQLLKFAAEAYQGLKTSRGGVGLPAREVGPGGAPPQQKRANFHLVGAGGRENEKDVQFDQDMGLR